MVLAILHQELFIQITLYYLDLTDCGSSDNIPLEPKGRLCGPELFNLNIAELISGFKHSDKIMRLRTLDRARILCHNISYRLPVQVPYNVDLCFLKTRPNSPRA